MTRAHDSAGSAAALVLLVAFDLGCRAQRAGDDRSCASRDAPRLAMVVSPRAKPEFESKPTPLVYGGGFLPKTLVFETLVDLDASARPVPALAESWEASEEGRVWTFTLREGATFHEGERCDARAVREHFLRWLGDEEDRFIGAATRIVSVDALGERTVRFELNEPHFLPADLAIINPMAVVGPRARRGEAVPCLDGTGPWAVERYEPMRGFRFRRHARFDGPMPQGDAVELELFVAASGRDAVGLWALERGLVDALVEDWWPAIPREKARALAADGRFELDSSRGSAVLLLEFNPRRAPFSDVAARKRVAAAVDRARLIEVAEAGFADPVTGLFAPWIEEWPQPAPPRIDAAAGERVAATMVVADSDPTGIRLALELRRQLQPVAIELDVRAVDRAEAARRDREGEFDLALTRTWGVPYDPQCTLFARFGPQPEHQTAVETPTPWQSEALNELALAYQRALTGPERAAVAARVQEQIDREVAVVPLYAPRRIAIRRPSLYGLGFGEHGYEIDLRNLRLAR
jgi:nickel transport system substrate-binding protein